MAEGQLDAQRLGHFISDYDYEITLKVAEVLAGGDVPRNTYINQRYLQKLKKNAFNITQESKRMTEFRIC